jgi:hypothetical protein
MGQHRRFHRLLVFLLCLCALQVVVAMRAHASCGDWLSHSPGDMRPMGSGLESWADGHATRLAETESGTANHLPHSKPCEGPFCRSAPALPLPAAPARIVTPTDKLAVMSSDAERSSADNHSYFAVELGAHASRGFPTRIEHPPRV